MARCSGAFGFLLDHLPALLMRYTLGVLPHMAEEGWWDSSACLLVDLLSLLSVAQHP